LTSGKSGSIALFLRNLPPNTNCKAIKTFVQTELHKAGVRSLPFFSPCTNCSILCITDLDARTIEYHGLVEVRPAALAIQAIAILNGKELHGTPIEVRRYRHRFSWSEHRHRSDSARGGNLVARLLTEHRRANLRIALVQATPPADRDGTPPLPAP
jgi:hypothetical protein